MTVLHHEETMGTVVSFAIEATATGTWRPALAAACEDLHHCDRTFSPWREDSAVSRLRAGTLAEGEAPAEVREVLGLCRAARTVSAGWFDPWALPGGVDPTGLVKGWALARAAGILRSAGVASGMVNAGGDIALWAGPGGGARRIGIRHPWRPEGLAAVVALREGAIATSGVYERGPHLIDPFAGAARAAVASATVTGPSASLADALATALAVSGPGLLGRIGRVAGYEAYTIGWDGVERATPGMPFADPAAPEEAAAR